MQILAESGARFEIALLGFQHPRGRSNEIDTNRLLVRIVFATAEGSWSEIAPCLVAWEFERLTEWMEALSAHRATDAELRFLEPDLRFRILPAAGVARVLRVGIDLRLRHPGRAAPVGELDFPMEDEAIARAARALRIQARRFPTREPV